VTDSIGTRWAAAIARLAEGMGDTDRLFTWAEVEFMMAAREACGYRQRMAEERRPDPLSYEAGVRDGYRQRVAEENAAYPSPLIFDAATVAAAGQVLGARAEARADKRQRWAGGDAKTAAAAFLWEADRPDPVVPAGRLYVRMEHGVTVWDEDRIAGHGGH
jgi:hypothetical protein